MPPQFSRDKKTGLYAYEPTYWDGDKPGTKEIAALLAQVQPGELFKVIAIEPVNAKDWPLGGARQADARMVAVGGILGE